MVAGLGNVQLRNQHLALLWQREVFITSFMTNKDLKNKLTGNTNAREIKIDNKYFVIDTKL